MSVKLTGNFLLISCHAMPFLLVSGERFPRNSTTAVLSFLSKFIIVIVLDIIHIFH